MRYLVILDARSATGSIYASGNNDGFVRDGELRHPFLDCSEVVTDAPYYLFAKRDRSRQGQSYQSMYIPHGSIVYIHCYADEEPRPIGFMPPEIGKGGS